MPPSDVCHNSTPERGTPCARGGGGRGSKPHGREALGHTHNQLCSCSSNLLSCVNEEQHTSPSSLRGASYLTADVWDEVLGLRRNDLWGAQNVFSLAHLVHVWQCYTCSAVLWLRVVGAQCGFLACFSSICTKNTVGEL